MTNRAERRARARWQDQPTEDALTVAMRELSTFSEAVARMSVVSSSAAFALGATGGGTPAQREALARWAIPAAAAFRRATADLDRLGGQLASIASLEGG